MVPSVLSGLVLVSALLAPAAVLPVLEGGRTWGNTSVALDSFKVVFGERRGNFC